MNRQQITTKGKSQRGILTFLRNPLWDLLVYSIPIFILFSWCCVNVFWTDYFPANLIVVLQISAFWKWPPMLPNWNSTKKPLKFMNRCVFTYVCVLNDQLTAIVGFPNYPFMSLFCVMLRSEHMQWTASCWSMVLKITSSKQLCVTSVWTCLMQGWVFIFLIPTHQRFASM